MLEIDNFLLFLNLSRKGRVIWKRFKTFQEIRPIYQAGTLLGFYPSRDLYTDSTWSVYEIRDVRGLMPDPEDRYVSLIWDYLPPAQRGIPKEDIDYFMMRPVNTALSYKPMHYYQSEERFMRILRRLHPKLAEFTVITK